MKKLATFLCVMMLALWMTGTASALYFYDEDTDDAWVSTYGTTPVYWHDLGLPNWYDADNVTAFDITISGNYDNSYWPIDIFISFDGGSTYLGNAPVASYNVDNWVPFTLRLDILNSDLFYSDPNDPEENVGSVLSDAEDFDNKLGFSVGYGCHFKVTGAEVEISQVPEPATMLLLGTGLVGLAGIRRKIKK